MKINVIVDVPDGETCKYKDGYSCPWILKHDGSGQRWCRIFDQKGVPIEDIRIADFQKCKACREACKK